MVLVKKKGYFIFTILFGILVTLIYFLFAWRINGNNFVEKDFRKYDYKIIFINKYNLPLSQPKIIPASVWLSTEVVGWTIEAILLNYQFDFNSFVPINKNTLQKKYQHITTIGLVPKAQYIKWYPRQLVTKQLLAQVSIPNFLQPEVIKMLQDRINSSTIIITKLQQYLSGSYLKYFNIIRLFCVF
ncbi:hypothetical protein S100390_v1c01060 [Spiroplasma sp. NBRC 100390]|uniref:hypothetical protein n=1 Tax=unclassified Spiroplasma TaxID=2637901 RepID=UPI0008929A0B|nr:MULTISPECIES: hypothetical protein [unclassified Spiroplasma]AOX43449.1 hypothetical protein STU14_v1c01060 [Spiroplasma sp. TU-14]APE12919.1 hypothetical protein S100390_v1c01060 [Spiroplasma sp. NBRC 100390]